MKLSVVIVNYNVKYFLEQALRSVRKASNHLSGLGEGYETEVFVVDNNSVDGSVPLVKEKFPEVRIIANKENAGFSKANNQAIRIAEGEYVLLLNPDTVVEEDTFAKIILFMEAHPDAGGLGVKMIDGKGNFLPESKRGFPSPEVAFYKAFGLSALFPRSRIFGKYHLGYLDKEETNEVDVLAGAFMLVRKNVLDDIGYLDEDFFMYGEDIDLSYRIKLAGYKNFYYPETRIIHYKGESTKKSSINYVFIFYKAMIIFAKKHFSKKKAQVFASILNFAIYFRAGLSIIHRFLKKLVLPMMDFFLMFSVMYFLKTYWEHNHKYVEGGKYPWEFMLISVPIGIFLWMLGNYFADNYRKPFRYSKIIRGVFLGTLFILIVYALLPESARSSRALIILGAIASVFVFTFNRTILQFINFQTFYLGQAKDKKIIIVGFPDEAKRVFNLLESSSVRFNFIGFVTPGKENNGLPPQYIGKLRQLSEVVKIYNVQEIIFCARDIPSQEIINWMSSISISGVEFKIAPEKSLFIIGSSSKDHPGDFYTIDIELSISRAENQVNKRLLDIAVAVGLLITIPINMWFVKDKGNYFKNIFRVIIGKRTWVGYAVVSGAVNLPPVREGVLNPSDEVEGIKPDADTISRLNFLYARDYDLVTDLKIILNGFTRLGK